ncbi:MAG: hypothetical protein HOW73_42195 [Polyangiaceae bacterium]|nr:hypothetical protein [Polyangiaceae bacterium]
MRRRLFACAASFAAVGFGFIAEASAGETAVFCAEDDLTCETAPIAFSKEIVLPVQGGFDTGWIPANSPLQVHLWAQLWANSYVDLAGHLETSWPEALTLAAIPEPGAGEMGIHYGVDVGAQAHVEITVLGQTFQWTGDIPYVPQFDFQVEASSPFDPWAFEGISIDGSTQEATLAQVSVEDFISLDIPGLDGGFELNTYVDLTATYQTKLIDIVRRPDDVGVDGGGIDAEDDLTSDIYAGEAGIDYGVRPVGEIVYDGVLHLVPAFYIETIGPDFSIPIADFPIPFQFIQKDWDFDFADVHVPFPDVVVESETEPPGPDETLVVDLGQVDIGETVSSDVALANIGEALLAGSASLGGDDVASFTLAATTFSIDAGASGGVGVTFTAAEPGAFVTTIIFASNDPDEAMRTVEVRANVIEPDDIGDDDDGDADGEEVLGDGVPQGGGCACRAVEDRPAGTSGAALSLLIAGMLVARQRRDERGRQERQVKREEEEG